MPSRQRAARRQPVTSRPLKRIAARASARDRAGDQVEQRRLAGAVRPDDAERLALVERQVEPSATTMAP